MTTILERDALSRMLGECEADPTKGSFDFRGCEMLKSCCYLYKINCQSWNDLKNLGDM